MHGTLHELMGSSGVSAPWGKGRQSSTSSSTGYFTMAKEARLQNFMFMQRCSSARAPIQNLCEEEDDDDDYMMMIDALMVCRHEHVHATSPATRSHELIAQLRPSKKCETCNVEAMRVMIKVHPT